MRQITGMKEDLLLAEEHHHNKHRTDTVLAKHPADNQINLLPPLDLNVALAPGEDLNVAAISNPRGLMTSASRVYRRVFGTASKNTR